MDVDVRVGPERKLSTKELMLFHYGVEEDSGESLGLQGEQSSKSWPDAMILVFRMLSLKPTFSLSSFTFIKRLFSSSSLSAIRVKSSTYLKLLIFLPAILIPACASSSLGFLMMFSAYKLNKQGDNIQPWCTPFPICKQSVGPRPVLTVASWPAYRFLKMWVGWSGIPISFRIFHSLLWSTQSKALS